MTCNTNTKQNHAVGVKYLHVLRSNTKLWCKIWT